MRSTKGSSYPLLFLLLPGLVASQLTPSFIPLEMSPNVAPVFGMPMQVPFSVMEPEPPSFVNQMATFPVADSTISVSPIMQLVASLTHIVDMNMQNEQAKQQLHQAMQLMKQTQPPTSPRLALIPYGEVDQNVDDSVSRIVNSVSSTPPIMYRIGDLLEQKKDAQEPKYDFTQIAGYPISRVYDEQSGSNEPLKTFVGRLLGVDEIPTAKEGNAIAQLWS